MQQFRNPEFSVVRQHEEFIWLHDRYGENEEYAGIIVSFFVVVNFDFKIIVDATITCVNITMITLEVYLLIF